MVNEIVSFGMAQYVFNTLQLTRKFKKSGKYYSDLLDSDNKKEYIESYDKESEDRMHVILSWFWLFRTIAYVCLPLIILLVATSQFWVALTVTVLSVLSYLFTLFLNNKAREVLLELELMHALLELAFESKK